MNISEIKDLLAQFDASTLREFSYKNNGEELNLSKNQTSSVAATPVAPAVEVVAAFLNNMTKKDASDVPVKITPEKPLPRRKKGRRNGNYRRGNDNFKRSKRFNKHDRNNRDNKRRSGKKNRFTIRTKKA